jgi:hypothetical protein
LDNKWETKSRAAVHPDVGVKAGDVIYILHYIGEGYWKVWNNGVPTLG